MATRSVSPGGALLRSSRLFSLPAPLPPPSNPHANTRWNSDTMTTPYPTHQVITTVSTSRKNGDWGLKRPLPLRSTTKSTVAMLRVKAIDTMDQITDYSSGADHGITLLKFQELGLPIVTRDANAAKERANLHTPDAPQKSVFEDDIDFTAIGDMKERAELIDKRWKFQGPWLAGMQNGEFQKYIEKQVRPRRAQFRMFLRQKLAEEMNADAKAKAMDAGDEEPNPIRPKDISEEQLTNYLRRLRESNSTLFQMVSQFLDLAPLKPPNVVVDNLDRQGVKVDVSSNPYAENGPPRTHPSAGLSYLRTKNYIDNHPIYGPQEQIKPVVARLVKPRRQMGGIETPKFGIAGIISDVPLGDVRSNQKFSGSKNQISVDNLEVEVPGGPKMWVLPNRANIDSEGKILLKATLPKLEVELVAKELIGEGEGIFGKEREADTVKSSEPALARRQYSKPAFSSAKGYGVR
ncbi:mitochondrial ribosomal protein MRP51 [Podospora australis]|uniref:Mitochondrial ribosomal protein MRP51 n=1 Tax=Podospora australis TaxID=1536484 RepID=A0AAN6X212_9PEZI|nr:mitochondrial ribosomal protein MRP51 [Podospora australis]